MNGVLGFAGFREDAPRLAAGCFTLGVGLILAGSCGLAAGEVAASHGPRLVCDQPVYNFGTNNAEKPISHTFILRNTGDEPLTIRKCGRSILRPVVKRSACCRATEDAVHPSLKSYVGRSSRALIVRL